MVVPRFNAPNVFISYSWESEQHSKRVLFLANYLKDKGVDCHLDQDFKDLDSPEQGWILWMLEQFESSNFVLVVCTETYERRLKRKEEFGKGKGVTWEGSILLQELYDARLNSKKFIPVIFSPEDENHIPIPALRSVTPCRLYTEEGYETLYRYLTSQQEVLFPDKKDLELGLLKPVEKVAVNQNKALRQSLIHVFRELEEEDISIICFSILDSPSEIKSLPRKQPEMSAKFISRLDLYDRLPELTKYLEKYRPEVMKQVVKYLN